MKKLLTLAALLGVASLSYGQGYVSMFASSTAGTKSSTNGVTAGLAGGTAGSGFYYELLFAPASTPAPTSVSALSAWTPTTTTATGANGTLKGIYSGSTAADGVGIQVPGSTVGNSYAFVIVSWSANLGNTWSSILSGAPSNLVGGVGNYGTGATWSTLAAAGADAVVSPNGQPGGWFGISGVAGNIPTVAVGGNYVDVVGTTPGLIPGFGMNYYSVSVPEPGTLALTGLGAAAMLIFRRRK